MNNCGQVLRRIGLPKAQYCDCFIGFARYSDEIYLETVSSSQTLLER